MAWTKEGWKRGAEDSRSTDSFLNLKLFLDLSEAASALDCFEESKYKIIVAEVEAKECAEAYQEGKEREQSSSHQKGKGNTPLAKSLLLVPFSHMTSAWAPCFPSF